MAISNAIHNNGLFVVMNVQNSKIRVGTTHMGYPEIRNFAGLPFKDFEVVQTYDLCKLVDHLKFKLTGNNQKFCHNFHSGIGLNKGAQLFHFFNSVSSSKKPWVVTFEHALPRYNEKSERGIKLLASKNCKKIIAFCKNTFNVQSHNLNTFLQYKEAIESKTVIIHPSQKLYVDSIVNKKINQPITFTFIGGDFFRKGGLEILRAVDHLINNGFQLKLNIVSKMTFGLWLDEHINQAHINEAMSIIENHRNSIEHVSYLENQKVLELLQNSDVGLLPSYGETYGYSILESQACACPVVTTNMPPFDEINNDSTGWLVDVPLASEKGSKVSRIFNDEEIKTYSQTLEKNLIQVLQDILNNPDQILNKGKNSIKNIQQNHDILNVTERIETIYKEALGL